MTDANQEYSLGGFGARLKAAREALNLSQKDAALRLHLNPSVLEILESENFQKAPPATFLRGYLRSYARMLNFNDEEINVALTQSGLETQTRALNVPTLQTETMQIGDRHVQRISTYVVLGLFIFVGIWWGFHSSATNTNTLARSSQPITPVTAQPAQPPQPIIATTGTPAPVTAQTPAPAPAAVQPAPAAMATAAPAPTTEQPPVAQPSVPPQPSTAPTVVTATPAGSPATNTISTAPGTAPTPVPPYAAAITPPLAPTTDVPAAAPVTDPLATTPGATVANADSDSPKKRNRHHKQVGKVSGFSMALPEPGL